MDLAVRPSARLQGIGRSMIDDLLTVVAATDLDVTLEVRPSNKAAIDLYRSCGFEAVGTRRRYYEDNGEDAIVMLARGDEALVTILAIETSCDDTSAAVMTGEGRLLSSVVHTQDAIHEKYGGVVPEVASRAHVERASVVLREALSSAGIGIDSVARVAVTVGPGLIGALLVGLHTAKAVRLGPTPSAHSGQPRARPSGRGLVGRPRGAFSASHSGGLGGTHTRWCGWTTVAPFDYWDRPWTTPQARRSTKERGSWDWGIPGGESSTRWPRRETRPHLRFLSVCAGRATWISRSPASRRPSTICFAT